jgi:hypothetical protein
MNNFASLGANKAYTSQQGTQFILVTQTTNIFSRKYIKARTQLNVTSIRMVNLKRKIVTSTVGEMTWSEVRLASLHSKF